jgi:glyoxylase-like metal-dependent hydrolase (beta-lactamase superfamily II)
VTVVVVAILIEHPQVDGLILFETGCGPDMDANWGGVLQDVFAPTPGPFSDEQTLPARIKQTGHDIKDVKHIVMGRSYLDVGRVALTKEASDLHLDHAGGLEYFRGRSDVTVYTHELELKHAWWAVATKMDNVYLKNVINPDLNWSTFHEKEVELFPGMLRPSLQEA